MKDLFKADKAEVTLILEALYDKSGNFTDEDEKKADALIEDIASPIDDEFLRNRGLALKEMFLENPSLREKLAHLYDDYHMANGMWDDNPLKKYCNRYILDKQRNYDHKAPKMIDLFCGAGGLSLGFTQCGFLTSFANDIQDCCIDTYAHNHPETPRANIVLGDINNIINDLDKYLRFKDVDVIIGGPPCQGFSTANRQRIIDDPRNRLYKSYVKVVDLVKPKFFIMENVKGMLSVSSQVIEDFNNIGYRVSCRILKVEDFGIPQHRERLIFIGNNLGIDNTAIFDAILKEAAGCKKTVLKDALEGLRPLKALTVKNATEKDTEDSGYKIEKNNVSVINGYVNLINQGKKVPLVFNHKARYNNDRDIEIFRRLNPGDRSDDPKIADIMPYARRNGIFKDKYFKLEPDKVCKTITAHMKFDCNMYIHPYQARGLTPREAARVQSYPDDYFFRGSYTKTYMQIGNSVPPLLGRFIAKVIKRYLGQ